MRRFAQLLDQLAFEPSREEKYRLLIDYFSTQENPERSLALDILDGRFKLKSIKPHMLRALIAQHCDHELVALSYDYVGDLAETVALLWPETNAHGLGSLPDIVAKLDTPDPQQALESLPVLLDQADSIERWALLKLATGGLRVGVSSGMLREALARWSGQPRSLIDELWHSLKRPHDQFFTWLEGKGPQPPLPTSMMFISPMLAHPLKPMEMSKSFSISSYAVEWKWDGIRVQYHRDQACWQLYSRTGEDISQSFPELSQLPSGQYVVDGELLVTDDGNIASFQDLQTRLNRKKPSAKLIASKPAMIMAYDLLSLKEIRTTQDDFSQRRGQLTQLLRENPHPQWKLSQLVSAQSFEQLDQLRAHPPHPTMEGLMLKHWSSVYTPGRPKGAWWKWKKDPFEVDAVMLYAQRGHGRRSSLYSDFTFGCWQDEDLIPIGKAYFGFTDAELRKLDKFVRTHTINRFGPVREVSHEKDTGLVVTLAFEGVQKSSRHRSGLALRFPRIAQIRWDKKPYDAGHLSDIYALLDQ